MVSCHQSSRPRKETSSKLWAIALRMLSLLQKILMSIVERSSPLCTTGLWMIVGLICYVKSIQMFSTTSSTSSLYASCPTRTQSFSCQRELRSPRAWVCTIFNRGRIKNLRISELCLRLPRWSACLNLQ